MNVKCPGRASTRSIRIIQTAFGFVLALTSAANAQQPASILLHLDPSTTHIRWTLNTNIHTVHGIFKLKSGDVQINPVSGDATGLIVIDATSGESGENARDKRMHSAIIESAKYPTIDFRPARIAGKIDLVAGGPVTVTGIFSLHGQQHPLQIILTVQPQKIRAQPLSNAFTTHFVIPFVAWGLKDPSTFIFRTDKEVALDIDATTLTSSTD